MSRFPFMAYTITMMIPILSIYRVICSAKSNRSFLKECYYEHEISVWIIAKILRIYRHMSALSAISEICNIPLPPPRHPGLLLIKDKTANKICKILKKMAIFQ